MKITVYIASSANGFISGPKGLPDWLSQEYAEGMMKIAREKQAVIMGKTTYNIIAPDYLPLKDGGTTIVLTSDTNAKPGNPTVVFAKPNANEIVPLLEKRGHDEAVIIGGTATITEFLDKGLVQEVILIMEPVLFGKGLPLFRESDAEIKLQLVDVSKLNLNTIRVHYRTSFSR